MQSVTLSINDTCKALSLGRSTIYKLINVGDLEVIKLGRRTLVTRSSIDNLVKRSYARGAQN